MLEEVWMVFTEVNGYRNFYRDSVYAEKAKAEEVKEEVLASGKFDDAYVVGFNVDYGEPDFDAWREQKQLEDERRYNDYHERWMHEDF